MFECQISTSAKIIDLRVRIAQQVGLGDYHQLAIDFAGHTMLEDQNTVHEVGLCDQATIECNRATQDQQQKMRDLSKHSRGNSWDAWAGIEPRSDRKLGRQHSGMGASTGVAPNEAVTQVELDVKSDDLHTLHPFSA